MNEELPRVSTALVAAAMLSCLGNAGPVSHATTSRGWPSQPKSIPRAERQKRKAKKKLAEASKKRNRH